MTSLSSQPVIAPIFLAGQGLSLRSSIGELPLSQCQLELSTPGYDLAELFQAHPALSGVILVEAGAFQGLLPRSLFLEFLLKPHGPAWFLDEPLRVLHRYIRGPAPLILPAGMPILQAAQQALRRSPEAALHPIVVQGIPNPEGASHSPARQGPTNLTSPYYLLDLHQLNLAQWQLRGIEAQVRYERSQIQLLQTERMAQLGRLVDGVAHEILDPISFIWGNLTHVNHYAQTLITLLQAYEALIPDPPASLAAMREALEIDYLTEDLPPLINSLQTGAERLSKLAASLQNFCHIDEVHPKPADIHQLLDSTLLLLRSRISSEIQVLKHYGQLPPIPCFPGQLSQVLMTILSNAIEALLPEAASQHIRRELGTQPEQTAPPPQLILSTTVISAPNPQGKVLLWLQLRIANNGPALSTKQQQQIQVAFSPPWHGQKQSSLGISYQLITARHGGTLQWRSPCAEFSSPEFSSPEFAGSEFAGSKFAGSEFAGSEFVSAATGPELVASPRGVEFELHLPIT